MVVCKECGSDEVQTKEWVEINTGKNCGNVGGGIEDSVNNWCPKCEENVDVEDAD